MAVGDHYEIVCTGTLFSQQVINRLVYEQMAGAGDAESLSDVFTENTTGFFAKVANIQSNQFSWVDCDTFNLDDLADWHGEGVNDVGTVVDTSLPPFVCWSFRLARQTRAVRDGHKRIAGVPHSWVANGVYNGTGVTDMTAFLVYLTSTLSDLAGNTWSPRIFRRAGSMKGNLPLVNEYFTIGAADLKGVGSQNSRKLGRGA